MFFERSGYHLFSWRGIDVQVSMWYMILMAFIVFMPALSGGNMISGVLFALAITISLLIHEFGHALMCQRYKLGPSILLHGFGGVCMSDAAHNDGDDARILLAGPLSGLAAGVIAYLATVFFPVIVTVSPLITTFLVAFIWINIVWSLVNLLLPIWPLDGGQLFHLLLRRIVPEDRAQTLALNASIMTVIPAGIFGLYMFRSLFIGFICFFIIMDNYNALKNGYRLLHRPGKQKASKVHEELLEEARQAMIDGDWREAARLAHVMRSMGKMPSKMLDEVWIVLGISTTELGEYEEAISYLKRAPDSEDIREAIQYCETMLEDK